MERASLYKSKRARLDAQRAELLTARQSIEPDWQLCADFIQPHRLRLHNVDQTDLSRKGQEIIDGTGSDAASVLEAGMTSMITSPSRVWFRLTPPDKDMAEWGPVKDWLHAVQTIMLNNFARSNWYSVVPTVFGDMGTYATAAMSMVEDYKTVFNNMVFPVGEYCIGVNHRGRPNVFDRQFSLTVRQLVEMFGKYDETSGRPKWEAFSNAVRSAWDNSNYGIRVKVCHAIEPNIEYNSRSILSKYKRFYQCYYEEGADDGRFLEEAGFDYFPILAPRWRVTGHDAWGTDCPGFRALGDIMQLQFGEKMGLQALELKVKPPMKAHTSLMGAGTSQLPGHVTWTDSPDHFQALYQIQFSTQELEAKNESVRRRIDQYYHKPLFLRVLSDDRNQRATAAEIMEGKEEKFIVLGPTANQCDKDLLGPAIDLNFMLSLKQRRFPDPPKELHGMPLQIEWLNLATQAQKMFGIAVQDRYISFQERIMKIAPQTAAKFNFDQQADDYADALGVNPKQVRSDDEVIELRAAEAKAMQAEKMGESIERGTQSIKNLALAPTSGDNALTELMAQAEAGGRGGVA